MVRNIKKSKNNRNKDKRKYRKRRTNKKKFQISRALKSKKQFGGVVPPDFVDIDFKSPEERALHDSIHDFKTLISDVLHYIRTTGNISLHRTAFTFLLKECFPSIQIQNPQRNIQHIAEKCGRYTSPKQRLSSCCGNLENEFLNNNIYNGQLVDNIYHYKQNKDNNGWTLNGFEIQENPLNDMAQKLKDANWGSEADLGEEKINLMVDTQKGFFKYLQKDETEKQWRYILTKESMFDPAGKLNGKYEATYAKRIGPGNYYWECSETTPDNPREYNNNKVKGKYNIQLEKLDSSNWFDDKRRPQIKYTFKNPQDNSLETSGEITMNTSSKHSNSIGQVKKQINKKQKEINIHPYQHGNTGVDGLYHSIFDEYDTDVVTPYKRYMNGSDYEDLVSVYIRELSKKRYSDELMAEVCRYVLTNDIYVETPDDSHSFYMNESNPLVLLTIDRMLFVAGLESHKNIPCILDRSGKKGEYYLYIPTKDSSVGEATEVYRGGGITALKGGAAPPDKPSKTGPPDKPSKTGAAEEHSTTGAAEEHSTTGAVPQRRSRRLTERSPEEEDNLLDYYDANPLFVIKYIAYSFIQYKLRDIQLLAANSYYAQWLNNNNIKKNTRPAHGVWFSQPDYNKFIKLVVWYELREMQLTFDTGVICTGEYEDETEKIINKFLGNVYNEINTNFNHLYHELNNKQLKFVYYEKDQESDDDILYTISVMGQFFKFTKYFLEFWNDPNSLTDFKTNDKTKSVTHLIKRQPEQDNYQRLYFDGRTLVEHTEQIKEKNEVTEDYEHEYINGAGDSDEEEKEEDGHSAAANGSGGGGGGGGGGGFFRGGGDKIKKIESNKKFVTDIQDTLQILKEYERLILFDEEESYKYYFDDGVDRYFKLVNYWELNFFMKELCLRKKRSENISSFMHYLYTASDDNLFVRQIYNAMIDIISYVFSDRDPIIFFENAGSDYEPLEFKVFMNELAKKFNNIEVKRQNLFTSLENQNISIEELKKTAEKYSTYSSYGFTEMYYNMTTNKKEEKRTNTINLNISEKVNKNKKRLSQKLKKGKNNGTQKLPLFKSFESPLLRADLVRP